MPNESLLIYGSKVYVPTLQSRAVFFPLDMADDEKDVAELAKRAVEADRTKQVELAIFYYTLAAEALLNLQIQGPLPINIAQKAHEYINRAEVLKKSGNYYLSTFLWYE